MARRNPESVKGQSVKDATGDFGRDSHKRMMSAGIRRIAAKTGCPIARVVEEIGERAAIREFEAGMPKAFAEAKALDDVENVLTRAPSTQLSL